MSIDQSDFFDDAKAYVSRIQTCFTDEILLSVHQLANDLKKAWIERRSIYICGNGGSAANALHIANDFQYGLGKFGPGPDLPGICVEALPSNCAVLSCLANDIGYENIFSYQLEVKGKPGDILLVLSGSGNSENIIKALDTANKIGIETHAILAFSGGKCMELAGKVIYFPVNDMQVAEDCQMIVSNICLQWLNNNKPSAL